MPEEPKPDGLMDLSDPYRSMAYLARDLAWQLRSWGHVEQAETVEELLAWAVELGRPAD